MQKQVIDYAGIPVGIVVPTEGSFRFLAVKFPVMELDGNRYPSVVEVRRAIHTLLSGRQTYAA
jgi:hypothetical protein